MKKQILSMIIASSILSATVAEFSNIGTITPEVEENIKRFKHLETSNIRNVDEFRALAKDFESIDKQIARTMKNFKGSKFFTKKEFQELGSKVLKARSDIKKNNISEFILVLTSTKVPSYHYANILHSVGILQENGIRIKSKIYLQGVPENFKKFMFDKKDYFNGLTKKERKYILPNFGLKIDPRLFEKFQVVKAPALVLATCRGKNPTEENCKFSYVIHGDASLTNFFDKIKDKDKRYTRYFESLISNKINYEGDKNE